MKIFRLLESNVDVDASETGLTALECAAKIGDYVTVKVLLDNNSITSLQTAA